MIYSNHNFFKLEYYKIRSYLVMIFSNQDFFNIWFLFSSWFFKVINNKIGTFFIYLKKFFLFNLINPILVYSNSYLISGFFYDWFFYLKYLIKNKSCFESYIALASVIYIKIQYYIYIYIYMVDSHEFCPLVVWLFFKDQLFYSSFKAFPI